MSDGTDAECDKCGYENPTLMQIVQLFSGVKRNTVDQSNLVEKYRSGQSMASIASDVGVSATTIGRWFDRWGVEKRSAAKSISDALSNSFDFTEVQTNIIEGELLGDGCLQNYSNRPHSDYCFALNNTVKGHCEYVVEKLPDGLFTEQQPYGIDNAHTVKQIWKIQSKSCDELTEMYEMWYSAGKSVPDGFDLTETALYHWFIGDGGRPKGNKQRGGVNPVRLATDGFSESGVEHLSTELERLGYENNATVQSNAGKSGMKISLTADATRRFLKRIDNPIPGYDYKFGGIDD
jgi:hypothetical protein